jgi:phosphatidylglycerophosphate synthase
MLISHKNTELYSKTEMKTVHLLHKIKAVIFAPIIWTLNKLRITANMISITSALVVLGFFFWSIYTNNPTYFIIALWIQLLLDTIDGPLARYQKKDTIHGTIMDASCDHFGIIMASVFMIYFGFANPTLIIIYTVLYTIVVILAFKLLFQGKRYEVLIRPGGFIYMILTVDYLWGFSFTNIAVLVATVLFLMFTVQGITVTYKSAR